MQIAPSPPPITDDTIDENYGVAVVFHEDEDEGERAGEGRRGREVMVAHDDERDMELDEDEGVEAEYDEVLKTAVSTSATWHSLIHMYCA